MDPREHPAGAGERFDLIAAACTGEARANLDECCRFSAATLEQDGIAYFAAPFGRRRPLAEMLAANGLTVEAAFLHLPHWHESRTIASFGLIRQIPALAGAGRYPRLNRMGSWLAGLPGAQRAMQTLYPWVGIAARRPGAAPLFQWMDPGEQFLVLLRKSWHDPQAAIAYLYSKASGELIQVLKIPARGERAGRLDREAEALARASSELNGEGIRIPRPLGWRFAGRPVLVQSALQGTVAASLLWRKPKEFGRIVTQLARFLQQWHARTRTAAPESAAVVAADLARAASLLKSQLPLGETYFRWLQDLYCRVSSTLPAVASHSDLTMWNILVTRDGLGILDWEEARTADAPLGDFFYAACDAAAATSGYRDRLAAFDECFFRPQGRSAHLAALLGGMVRQLGLDRDAVTFCFHFCWLRHAVNDISRPRQPNSPTPFLEIVRRLSSQASPRDTPPGAFQGETELE